MCGVNEPGEPRVQHKEKGGIELSSFLFPFSLGCNVARKEEKMSTSNPLEMILGPSVKLYSAISSPFSQGKGAKKQNQKTIVIGNSLSEKRF